MRTTLMACLGIAFCPWVLPVAVAADSEAAVTEKGEAIDPRHRGDTSFKAKDPRYYVWYEEAGWSLRCASLPGVDTKFVGTVEVIDGTFDKMRPVGLEKKGKKADLWELDGDRKKLTFRITTRGSFDGFDFTTKGGPETRVKYTLRMEGKPHPERIFIGKEGQHPKKGPFSFPAKP
jgi:hypothetical protein